MRCFSRTSCRWPNRPPAEEPPLNEEAPPASPSGGGDPGPPEAPEPRRYPSTIGGLFYILILLATVGAIGYVAVTGEWRTGVRVLSAAMGVGGVLRLIMPEKDAGMLAVRNRYLDSALLIGVGLTLAILTSSIPDQPPLG